MARQTRSSSGDFAPTFTTQNLLKNPEQEICSFDNVDIAALRSSGDFPDGVIFQPFDRDLRSDVPSSEWICFLAFPFTLGLRFPFSDFITKFFRTTGLSFSQTMPMVWRVLIVLDRIKKNHIPDLCVNDIPIVYRIRSHGSIRFLFYSTSNNLLILKATRNEEKWKNKIFFVKRDYIPDGDSFPVKWLTKGMI
ncbi:hypothetical protein Hanom_Chr06g00521121 [Helianthus anomalus]